MCTERTKTDQIGGITPHYEKQEAAAEKREAPGYAALFIRYFRGSFLVDVLAKG